MIDEKGVVVDASAVASWLLPDETNPFVLEKLIETQFHAPWLFWAEIRNILIIAERRGRLIKSLFTETVVILDTISIEFDTIPSSSLVLSLAQNHSLSVYDSLYLELALRLQHPLCTLDKKLAQVAKYEGIKLIS
ncbi:MAG: type II toxin-antitoxin system VapC family toxin [Rhodobacteraceae bacterium]|nr:type II toxin-antitoxin system VapC family toxin [Paracoccaceae bacterium]